MWEKGERMLCYGDFSGIFFVWVVFFAIGALYFGYSFFRGYLAGKQGYGIVVRKDYLNNFQKNGIDLISQTTGQIIDVTSIPMVTIKDKEGAEREYRIPKSLMAKVKINQRITFRFREGILGPKILKLLAGMNEQPFAVDVQRCAT